MYKSPIEIIYGQMQTQVENGIYETIQKYDINVDKEELIKALQYDRNQYEAGYKARDEEIVRCKDCKYFMGYSDEYKTKVEGANGDCYIRLMSSTSEQFNAVDEDDFCSYGERKEK